MQIYDFFDNFDKKKRKGLKNQPLSSVIKSNKPTTTPYFLCVYRFHRKDKPLHYLLHQQQQ